MIVKPKKKKLQTSFRPYTTILSFLTKILLIFFQNEIVIERQLRHVERCGSLSELIE